MVDKVAGVIGGMGPEATVDFLARIVKATPARDDADHIRVLVDNNPKIPSRIAALIDGTGESPLPTLVAMAKGLERQGADFLAIPCNTAHHYRPGIAAAVAIPVLDMVTLAIAKLPSDAKRIGMLASPAVQKIGLYATHLEGAGFTAVFPDPAGDAAVLDIIRAVKAGAVGAHQMAAYQTIAASLNCDAILIACTELSVLGRPTGRIAIDALDALVEATVQMARG